MHIPFFENDPQANSPRITTVLIGLFTLELIGMSSYSYWDLSSRLEPVNLVDRAEQALQSNYPKFKQQVRSDLETHAPEIASQISDELLAASPDLRRWLEHWLQRQLELQLDNLTDWSAERFRDYLQEHRETVLAALQELEELPETTTQLQAELEAGWEERMGVDLRTTAREGLQLHRQLNAKLARLSSDQPLTPKELLERRIVRIVRALQEERLPEILPE